MTRRMRGRAGSAAATLIAAALLVLSCSGSKQPEVGVSSEGKPVTAQAKPTPKPTPKPRKPPEPKPPGISLVVHDDCRLDGPEPVKLSKTSSTRVQWALEGGLGALGVELGQPQDEAATVAWKGDLVVRCPGTAECFGELQAKCTVGDRHPYRLVINGKACAQTGTIEIVP